MRGINRIGQRFGKLLVIEFAGANKFKRYLWKCKCDCGNEVVVESISLRSGKTKSCGCIRYDKLNSLPPNRHRRENVPIVTGIYKITNHLNEIYIGHSRTIYRRWLRHKEANRKIKLHDSLRAYGWDNHIFEIVHQLPHDVSNDTLINYEQLYIDLYKDCGCVMLNVKEAGSGGKFPQESKKKMSEANKKHYRFKYNDSIIEIVGLKEYCNKHGLGERQMSGVYNNNGHYGERNYYRGYSRAN